ncbi:hypothetical protein BC829DRAFT_446885 [Chytridium lagenaria]|nr:hypothetical protein BC829DRAFT_446885 [Chytridium lagenaria]
MPYNFGHGGGLPSSSLLLPSPSSRSLGYNLFMDAPGSTPSGLCSLSTNGSSTLFDVNGSSASSSSVSLPDLGPLLSPFSSAAPQNNGSSDVLKTFFVSSSARNHDGVVQTSAPFAFPAPSPPHPVSLATTASPSSSPQNHQKTDEPRDPQSPTHNATSPPGLLAPTAPSDRTLSRSSTAPPSHSNSPTPQAASTPQPIHLLTAPSMLSPDSASFLGFTPPSIVPEARARIEGNEGLRGELIGVEGLRASSGDYSGNIDGINRLSGNFSTNNDTVSGFSRIGGMGAGNNFGTGDGMNGVNLEGLGEMNGTNDGFPALNGLGGTNGTHDGISVLNEFRGMGGMSLNVLRGPNGTNDGLSVLNGLGSMGETSRTNDGLSGLNGLGNIGGNNIAGSSLSSMMLDNTSAFMASITGGFSSLDEKDPAVEYIISFLDSINAMAPSKDPRNFVSLTDGSTDNMTRVSPLSNPQQIETPDARRGSIHALPVPQYSDDMLLIDFPAMGDVQNTPSFSSDIPMHLTSTIAAATGPPTLLPNFIRPMYSHAPLVSSPLSTPSSIHHLSHPQSTFRPPFFPQQQQQQHLATPLHTVPSSTPSFFPIQNPPLFHPDSQPPRRSSINILPQTFPQDPLPIIRRHSMFIPPTSSPTMFPPPPRQHQPYMPAQLTPGGKTLPLSTVWEGFARRDALRRHEKAVAEGKKVHCHASGNPYGQVNSFFGGMEGGG